MSVSTPPRSLRQGAAFVAPSLAVGFAALWVAWRVVWPFVVSIVFGDHAVSMPGASHVRLDGEPAAFDNETLFFTVPGGRHTIEYRDDRGKERMVECAVDFDFHTVSAFEIRKGVIRGTEACRFVR